ncbi:hypothetical protein NE237_026208 [Protea cynaroides]|uniref:Uncharacterized protein n=1 Tax=Protea cynaroides TaxID=273540 RepID=A0A9Q0H7Q7_9MAGN|nr:hypothetical protein NE237_026208 [Protea cynaroides]
MVDIKEINRPSRLSGLESVALKALKHGAPVSALEMKNGRSLRECGLQVGILEVGLVSPIVPQASSSADGLNPTATPISTVREGKGSSSISTPKELGSRRHKGLGKKGPEKRPCLILIDPALVVESSRESIPPKDIEAIKGLSDDAFMEHVHMYGIGRSFFSSMMSDNIKGLMEAYSGVMAHRKEVEQAVAAYKAMAKKTTTEHSHIFFYHVEENQTATSLGGRG